MSCSVYETPDPEELEAGGTAGDERPGCGPGAIGIGCAAGEPATGAVPGFGAGIAARLLFGANANGSTPGRPGGVGIGANGSTGGSALGSAVSPCGLAQAASLAIASAAALDASATIAG